jgi:acyl carrier protein
MNNPTNETEIREFILNAIHSIAPEIEVKSIHPDLPLRDQVDIDSMDFFNLIVSIHDKLNIDIPESDYSKLTTLKTFVLYLKDKLLTSAKSA